MMIRKLLDSFLNAVIGLLRLNHAGRLSCELIQRINPVFDAENNGTRYRLYCPNALTYWRAQTFFEKEPETLEWIDGFQPDDVFFDIGANVGLYSVYAAKRGIRTVAFEPESQNYAILNHNVYLNGLSDDLTALNLALSDTEGVDALYLPEFLPGGALNNLGEAKDFKHERFAPKHRQGISAVSLDGMLARQPEMFPTHIKIDVDGLEERIINGGKKTLADPRVRSLLIELNEALPGDVEAGRLIESLGLRFKLKHREPMNSGGDFDSIFNYIFER